jgi:hypothetical protein
MLPASDLSAILSNLAALNLQPNTAAAVLGAVLAPLLRTAETPPAGLEPAGSKPSRLQRRGKRGGRGVASLFAVEFDDGRVGAETARNDLRGARCLALKHSLMSEQPERHDGDLV